MRRGIRRSWWALLVSGVLPGAMGLAQDRPVDRGRVLEARELAAAFPGLRKTIAVRFEGKSVEEALRDIASKADLALTYSNIALPKRRSVWLTADRIRADEALEKVLADAGLQLLPLSGGRLVVVPAGRGPAGTIAGRVMDAKTGTGIKGVELFLEHTRWRTTTDSAGQYRLADVDSGAYTLVARRLGYAKLTRRVTVLPDRADTVDLALEPVVTRLDELVTTATGRRRRLEIANDITTLNADSIVRTQPITSVTDLLEGRVPGLTVQRTSGAPGDPARLRLRGAGSPLRSNDPIVVVDGVRIYAEQSAQRNLNLAGIGDTTRNSAKNAYATPSPLDQIDPNSIETIEVVKGPSAATLYGPDAANGVIVITTKKGKAGPTRWTASADYGQTRIPGEYPELLLRWGHLVGKSVRVPCTIENTSAVLGSGAPPCEGDSVVTFQLLNDPALTVLDHGHRTALTLGASGGTQALTYAVTGSYQNETGLPRLPTYEAERYQARTGSAPPDWMRRPQQLTQWSVSGRFSARLGATADLSLNTQLSRTRQQRSSLEQQLGTLMGTYLDRASGTYFQRYSIGFQSTTTIVTSYYERATDQATNFTPGLNFDWRFRPWLTFTADAGLNVFQRADEIFLPYGAAPTSDSLGHFNTGQGTSLTSTVKARANATAPLGRGFTFRFTAGVDYTGTNINDLSTQTSKVAPGKSTRGLDILGLTPNISNVATFGWYLAPSVGNSKFNIESGLRLDGGSNYSGSGFQLPKFPKLGFSYSVFDEPFFPFKNLFQSFRIRLAYGKASRQPGVGERLRLYKDQLVYDGGLVPGIILGQLGNTEVRPERTTEFEGGLDFDLWDSRLSVNVSGYRKTTNDALLSVPVAPSVYGEGASVTRNIGVVRNTGLELTLNTQWVRSAPVTWGTQLSLTQNRNLVVKLGPGVEPFNTDVNNPGVRVVPGYPLNGRWSTPILGYADVNGDGVLQLTELQMGDTMVYVGQTAPNYTATLQSTLSFWHGALAVSAMLLHDNGVAQKNEVAFQLAPFSRGWNVPGTSLPEQVATADLTVLRGPAEALGTGDYNWIQTISTTRLQSLSVNYRLPARVARRLGAEQLFVVVQGTNLGLWTNYRGLDPNVNAFSTGNNITDTGILPQPRSWQLRVNATY